MIHIVPLGRCPLQVQTLRNKVALASDLFSEIEVDGFPEDLKSPNRNVLLHPLLEPQSRHVDVRGDHHDVATRLLEAAGVFSRPLRLC